MNEIRLSLSSAIPDKPDNPWATSDSPCHAGLCFAGSRVE